MERAFLSAYEEEIKKIRDFLKDQSSSAPAEELEKYVALNKTGLDKITKKYDKIVAYLQISRKKQGKPVEEGIDHMRHSNALLFIAELEPLASSAVHLKSRAGQWMRVVMCFGAITASAMIVAAAHTNRVAFADLAGSSAVRVEMPWHAYLILGGGWPFLVVAWFAGQSGLEPGSLPLAAAIVTACAITTHFLVDADAPAFPDDKNHVGWSWWIFLTVASIGNVAALYHVWPRQHDPQETRARVQALKKAFPADFAQRLVAPPRGGAAESKPTTWYRTQLRWCAGVYSFASSCAQCGRASTLSEFAFLLYLERDACRKNAACVAELCFAHAGPRVEKIASDLRSKEIQSISAAPCSLQRCLRRRFPLVSSHCSGPDVLLDGRNDDSAAMARV